MFTIVGIRKVNYTSKKTNQLVQGIEFHLLSDEELNTSEFQGQTVVCQYVSLQSIQGKPEIGSSADFVYSIMQGQPRITGIKIL